MASYKTYYKGDDIKEPILAYDDDDETIPVDLENDVIEIIISVYTSPTDVKKFSKTDKTVDGYVRLVKETSFLYYLIIEGSVTKNMKSGLAVIEVMLITSDSNFSGSRKNESSKGVLFELKESKNKAEL